MILGGNTDELNGEAFIGFIIVFSQLIRPVQGIATAHSNINKGLAAKDRVDEILNTHNAILEQKDALPVTQFNSEIRFENVTFRYETEDVLKNISSVQFFKTFSSHHLIYAKYNAKSKKVPL